MSWWNKIKKITNDNRRCWALVHYAMGTLHVEDQES